MNAASAKTSLPGFGLALRRWNSERRFVRLSHREKQSLYHSLSQLLRSGITLPTGLDKLAVTARGAGRKMILRVRSHLSEGKTAGEAFEMAGVSSLETSIIGAVEKSGQLERGLQQLSDYFGSLARARSMVISKCAYPLFLLHFGVFMLAAPTFFTTGAKAYLTQTLGFLGGIYVVVALLVALSPILGRAAGTNPLLDRVLGKIPLLGKVRRSFALSRFCAVYELQLDAGVNILNALGAAAQASASGSVRTAVERALPEVRNGVQVGPLLAVSGAFPTRVTEALIVGEETGGLERELKTLTIELHQEAVGALETMSEWLPKLIYLTIVLYLGWGIVSGYQRILGQYGKMLDM